MNEKEYAIIDNGGVVHHPIYSLDEAAEIIVQYKAEYERGDFNAYENKGNMRLVKIVCDLDNYWHNDHELPKVLQDD